MRRVPLWFAILLEIILISGWIDGWFEEEAIWLAIINGILLVPGLIRYIYARIELAAEKKRREDIIVKVVQMKALMRMASGEAKKVDSMVWALIMLNNMFFDKINRCYISYLQTIEGKEYNAQMMQEFIVLHAKRIRDEYELTEEQTNAINQLLENKQTFAEQKIKFVEEENWDKSSELGENETC